MVGACLTVANSSEHKTVWTGKDPADFATDLAQLQIDHAAVTTKAAHAESATGGAADAKESAETVLEDAAFVLARALASHFKKIGDLDRLGKVEGSKSDIVKLRTQDLANKATAIRDLGTVAQAETDAAKRGVTAVRVAALTAAIANFSKVMNSPRGQIANRGALLREVETDVAGLVVKVSDLDDLVLQFDGTEPGRRFIEAWRRARIIVDSGGGGGGTPPTPPSPTPPPTT
jgi:phage FluMu protein gp41